MTSTDQPTDDAHDRPDDGVELNRAYPRGFDDVQDSIDQLDEPDGTAATEHAPEDIDIYDARGRCLIVLPTPIGVVVPGLSSRRRSQRRCGVGPRQCPRAHRRTRVGGTGPSP